MCTHACKDRNRNREGEKEREKEREKEGVTERDKRRRPFVGLGSTDTSLARVVVCERKREKE